MPPATSALKATTKRAAASAGAKVAAGASKVPWGGLLKTGLKGLGWVGLALTARDIADETGLTGAVFGDADKESERYGLHFAGRDEAMANAAESDARAEHATLTRGARTAEGGMMAADSIQARREAELMAMLQGQKEDLANIGVAQQTSSLESVAKALGVDL